MDLDSYYVDRSQLAPEDPLQVNYDSPDAFDVALLVAHLKTLGQGSSVRKPVYCFRTHRRIGSDTVAPARLIVVEGLFPFWWEPVRVLLDLKVFVDAPADLRLIRRLQRDVAERGRTIDQVLDQYLRTVRPMQERYVEPARTRADVVMVNDGSIEDRVQELMARLAPDQVRKVRRDLA